ncbi:MAG: tryptophan 7-halogenase [Dolichospermum sp. WA123]|nr:tryptophan 7-halogenase [Dolichospermum sp. WA123]
MVAVSQKNDQKTDIQEQEYDVVIMGAGFAGVCQARHLLLKIPNIRVALIDPRPEDRTDKDLKIGESTVEIATLFICKELGLYEYAIENHPPKYGLNFHWAKDSLNTESVDDYYHIWSNRQPSMASIQMNRSKFERDLIAMNKKMGVTYYNGRVTDVDLTPGDEIKTVNVKVGSQYFNLKTKHVIDAAGRKFIIGKKTDNIQLKPEDLFGVNTGSVWVRIKNVDRNLFHNGYDPTMGSCSHYYATNHWFGHGHWLWMIPTEIDSKELSIGVIYHRDAISDDQMNTQEKFHAFLKANHHVLYNLISNSENFLENAKYETARCNVFAGMKNTYFYQSIWYTIFRWKAFGLLGVLAPIYFYYFFQRLIMSAQAAIVELVYKYQINKVPTNTKIEQMRQEFNQSYQYLPELQPWNKV